MKPDLAWPNVAWPDSLMIADWPEPERRYRDDEAEEIFGLLQGIVRAIRNIRSKMNLPDRRPLKAVISVPEKETARKLAAHENILQHLASVEEIACDVDLPRPPKSATDVIGQIQVFVPLEGILDLEEERRRLGKRIEEVENGLAIVEKKLANANFVERAPEEVVNRERERKDDLAGRLEKLRQSLAELDEG